MSLGGGVQFLIDCIAGAGVLGQCGLPGVSNVRNRLVKTAGDAVELAGQGGGQLLLAGGGGFGQGGVLLRGVSLQLGLGVVDRSEQGSGALLESVGVGGERGLLLLVCAMQLVAVVSPLLLQQRLQ